MRVIIIFTFLIYCCLTSVKAQTTFHIEDISHFYEAFDSIQTTNIREKQISFVQKIYIDKDSKGLEYAIRINEQNGLSATATDWLDYMIASKEHFIKIRPFFNNLPLQMSLLQENFVKFKEQYPSFKDGDVYFIIGLGLFGGRPEGNNLYIGCEVLANNRPDWAVNIVLHEFVHTLQKHSNNALLAHCLNEGACDFIAELISGIPLKEAYPKGYIAFGYENEAEIWKEFKKYISSNEKGRFFDWLYGNKGKEINGVQMRDLGYFMGYRICHSYYDNAVDKKEAIKEIIEMDVSQDELAKAFLIKSNYVPKKDKKIITNLEFSKLTEVKGSFKFVRYGYDVDKDMIVFKFVLPESLEKEDVQYVTVAGNFNGWNPNDFNYKMENTEDNIYKYRIPKTSFTEEMNEFKFVINGNNWQAIPDDALNTQNGNLTLEIKKR